MAKPMNIPAITPQRQMDGMPGFAAKSHVGEARYYRWALENTLHHLKPKYCLEIGTNMGETAQLFSEYFQQHEPSGFLITADVGRFTVIDKPNVHSVLVYPHVFDVDKHCDVPTYTMLCEPTDSSFIDISVELNVAILKAKLAELNAEHFDFCFLDGDHHTESARKDLEIVKRVVKPPYYTVFDDTHDFYHEAADFYHNNVRKDWNTYEFDHLGVFTGCSLIWQES